MKTLKNNYQLLLKTKHMQALSLLLMEQSVSMISIEYTRLQEKGLMMMF